jgi:hypothetical protein
VVCDDLGSYLFLRWMGISGNSQRKVMYQDLLKDTAAELERLKAATQAVGDRREKETVSVLLVVFHVVRELDKRQDDLVRRIIELERLATDHGEELRNLRRRLERQRM